MGVLCQVPAMSKHPVAPSTASCCHGSGRMVLLGQPCRLACVCGGAYLFFLHLVILPIIMERLERFPFMQVSPHFSRHSFPVGPVVPQPCSPAAKMLGMKWGVAEPDLLCHLFKSLVHQRSLRRHGEAVGGWQGLVAP